jgi:hypothetical protein
MGQAIDQWVFFSSSDTLVSVNGGAAAAGAPVAGTAWVTLDFGPVSEHLPVADRRRKLIFDSVMVLRATGASATAHVDLLADVTGSLAAAWATKYAGASVAAATRTDVNGIAQPLFTDATGKLFWTPGGDAADTFDYFLAFKWAL